MNFMFSWQEQYLTRSLRSLVRYCSCHSNIKFISSRHRVISSMYLLYYTILYYTILYYTILYYTILYYTILYYTTPVLCYFCITVTALKGFGTALVRSETQCCRVHPFKSYSFLYDMRHGVLKS